MDRREFLKRTGLGVAAVRLAGCSASLSYVVSAAVFEVGPDRAVIWASGTPGGELEAVIEEQRGQEVARATIYLDADGTGTVDVVGLAPGTRYLARVRGDEGSDVGPYAFVSAPADGDTRPVRFAWSADVDIWNPAFTTPIFRTLADLDLDFFVSLGDFPYTDNEPAAITVDEYRARHREARNEPRIQALLRSTSLRCIYDDHEFRNDWDAAAWAAEPHRGEAALTVWDQWFAVRGGPGGARYRRWRWGQELECFLLDTRSYRSASSAPDGPDKTMLGAAQKQWLIDGVLASTARFKVVFTTVPLDYGISGEHWNAYRDERNQILAPLIAARGPGLLFLSGDHHWFASHRHQSGIREFQAGPLCRDVRTPPAPVEGVIARVADYNAGVVEIDGAGALRVRCIGPTGATLYDETVTVADLTPA